MTLKKNIEIAVFILLFIGIYQANAATEPREYISVGANGAVSCGHPMAARIAINVLKNGGNAVDAAVATAFALGVVDFTNSGIGGEGFALICNPNGSAMAIDGSTRRPVGQVKNHYDCPISLPAIPEMLIKMNRLYGKVTLNKLIQPAIKLCNDGFEVSPYLVGIISNRQKNIKDPAARNLIAPEGELLKAGHLLKQPKLASTLQKISDDGGLSFYYGTEADKTIADMQSKGAFYTKYDFMNYKSRLNKPVKLYYKNCLILGHPFPSSAPITMKLAEELAESGIASFTPTDTNILRIANIYRKYLNRKHYDSAKYINNSQSFMSASFGEYASDAPDASDSNTTHLCVWDKDNLVVSMTLTLGNHFGTGQLAPGGYFYANSLRTYSNKIVNYPKDYPKNAGSITSKSPIIVIKSGKPWLAIGGAGADRIITNTATVLAKVIEGCDLYESLQAPRFYLDYYSELTIEKDQKQTSEITINDKSYKIVYKPYLDDFFGLVSAIRKGNNQQLEAVGDKHRDGSCAAY